MVEERCRAYIWLPGIVACVARFLSPNEIACTLRLVDKATSQQFVGFKSVQLSLPSPTYVFKQRWGAPEAFSGLTLNQRLKFLHLTAASGSVSNLTVALSGVGLLVTERWGVLEAAAKAGQLEACMLLWERGCPWGNSLASAAKGGHQHVCEWMLVSGCPLTSDATYKAARGGHEDLMRWLRDALHEGGGAGLEVEALLAAAAHGLGLEVLQRLHQQLLGGQQQQEPQEQRGGGGAVQQQSTLDPIDQGIVVAAAAGSPTPDWQAKVEWLEGLGFPRPAVAGIEAAKSSQAGNMVGRLKWLHGRGYPLDGAADIAASKGDLAALRFLVEQAGVQPEIFASLLSASHGHLAILQYLHAGGAPLDAVEVARSAASEGHLHVVVWAVEALGVTPDNTGDLLDEAAGSGSIELMAWLRERGWACSRLAVRKAAECGCGEALEWLVGQGCMWPVNGVPYLEAASHCDLATVRCLQRLGCPWGHNPLGNCVRNFVAVPMLQCLVEMGCPVDWEATMKSAKTRRPGEYRTAVMAWLEREQQRRSGG